MNYEFRGKMKNQYTEEWFYGDLLQDTSGNKYIIGTNYNTRADGLIELNTCQSPKVLSETVGQYTGLKDKNGKKIYEGDAIDFSYDIFTGNFDTRIGKGIIEFIGGSIWIKTFEIENKRLNEFEYYRLYEVNEDELEVIGNIHDNPEMSKGE